MLFGRVIRMVASDIVLDGALATHFKEEIWRSELQCTASCIQTSMWLAAV